MNRSMRHSGREYIELKLVDIEKAYETLGLPVDVEFPVLLESVKSKIRTQKGLCINAATDDLLYLYKRKLKEYQNAAKYVISHRLNLSEEPSIQHNDQQRRSGSVLRSLTRLWLTLPIIGILVATNVAVVINKSEPWYGYENKTFRFANTTDEAVTISYLGVVYISSDGMLTEFSSKIDDVKYTVSAGEELALNYVQDGTAVWNGEVLFYTVIISHTGGTDVRTGAFEHLRNGLFEYAGQ